MIDAVPRALPWWTRWRLAARLSPATIGGITVALGLLVVSAGYGFHRDELYFIVAGRHPALGYVDQPPLTPILSALAVWLLGMTPVAVRILPALAIGGSVAMTADLARRFGGGRRAQALAAAAIGGSGFLAIGHLGSTTTYDLFAWTVILWLVTRVLDGGDRRLWLLLGLAMGAGLENRYLVGFLGLGLGAGVVLARRWDVIRSPYAWLSVGIAFLLWAPNLVWQVANGWPQLQMARVIARKALAERDSFAIEVFLLSGTFLVFVPVAGAAWLFLARRAKPWRPIAWAAVAVVALVLVTNGKSYYLVGVLPALAAAGGVALDGFLARHRSALVGTTLASVASVTLMVAIGLPVVPASSLRTTPIADLYKEAGEQIGWPELVAEVRAAVDAVPVEQRAGAIILTANYGEASAIWLLGPDLPPVYSGHNGYWAWGPPPDGATVAIVVAGGGWTPSLGSCEVVGLVRNEAKVPNEELGTPIRICHGLPTSWPDAWPGYRHLD